MLQIIRFSFSSFWSLLLQIHEQTTLLNQLSVSLINLLFMMCFFLIFSGIDLLKLCWVLFGCFPVHRGCCNIIFLLCHYLALITNTGIIIWVGNYPLLFYFRKRLCKIDYFSLKCLVEFTSEDTRASSFLCGKYFTMMLQGYSGYLFLLGDSGCRWHVINELCISSNLLSWWW